MAAQDECPVCCESFNKSTHKPLKCPYCNIEMCRTCTGQSIMYDVGDPGCQSCKKVWSDDVLYSFFTKKYVDTAIAEKLKKKYNDLESSLLPTSQYYASKIKKVNHMKKMAKNFDRDIIKGITTQLRCHNVIVVKYCQFDIKNSIEPKRSLEDCLNDKILLGDLIVYWAAYNRGWNPNRDPGIYLAYFLKTVKTENQKITPDIQLYLAQLDNYNTMLCKYPYPYVRRESYYNAAINRLTQGEDMELKEPIEHHFGLHYTLDKYSETHKKGNVKYIMKCAAESCNGYLNEDALCEQCETQYCKKCEEVKAEGHECKKENVESVKLKYKNSKPCPNPNCGVPIFKTHGCSQMWCTACHTVFDWNTQSIVVTKNIHNPHYHEYNRVKQEVEPDEGECGRPSTAALEEVMKVLDLEKIYKKGKSGHEIIVSPRHHKYEFVLEFRRILGEVIDGGIMRYYPDVPYNENMFTKERTLVIMGLYDKDKLGNLVLEQVRANTFNAKVRENYYMLCTTGIDILRKMVADHKNAHKYYIELYNLCCMFNEEGRKLYNTYKFKFRYLTWHNFRLNFSHQHSTIKESRKKKGTNWYHFVLFEYDPFLKEYIDEIKKLIHDKDANVKA